MRKFATYASLLACAVLFVFAGRSLVGCSSDAAKNAAIWTDVQKTAQGTQYVISAPGTVVSPVVPSTQPSAVQPLLDTARTVYNVAAQSDPTVQAVGGLLALVIGGIGIFAGHMAGSSTATASGSAALAQQKTTFASVLTEVANAATGFLPGPWSSVATTVLQDTGNHVVADPNTVTSVSTVSPAAKV